MKNSWNIEDENMNQKVKRLKFYHFPEFNFRVNNKCGMLIIYLECSRYLSRNGSETKEMIFILIYAF